MFRLQELVSLACPMKPKTPVTTVDTAAEVRMVVTIRAEG